MPFDGGIVDATPVRRVLHLQFIDSEGKPRTDSYDIVGAATDAEINTFAAETGERSNASLWNVGVTNWFYLAQPSKANAVDETNDSVADNIVLFVKPLVGDGTDVFIPAPNEAATMVAGTENPSELLLADWITAANAIIDGSAISVRFTERRQKNKAVKL
jgi:hypothetical protein